MNLLNRRVMRIAFLLPLLVVGIIFSANHVFAVDAWGLLGDQSISINSSYFTSMAVAPDGTQYIGFNDGNAGNKATVMKYDGTSWEAVGTAGFSGGGTAYTSLAIAPNGTPYIGFADASNSEKATVMKFNGTTWEAVGTAGFSGGAAEYTSLKIAPDATPYIAYRDASNSNKATVMKFNGTAWELVGTAGFSDGEVETITLAISSANVPYVAIKDVTRDYKATVMRFNGTIWENVGDPGFSAGSADFNSLAFAPNGELYLAYEDGGNSHKATVMHFNGTAWESVSTPGFTEFDVHFTSLAIDSENNLYLAYTNSNNNNKVNVVTYNGDGWISVGAADFSERSGAFVSLVVAPNDTLYVGFTGLQNKAKVMKYGPASNEITLTGTGTELDPYMISSCVALQAVGNDVSTLDKYYALASDIDCSDTINWNSGKGFRPLGEIAVNGNNISSGFNHQSFTGVFDGQNHKISGLYINRGVNNSELDGYYVGLFRTIAAGAEVKNLELENVNITAAGKNIGAFAGGLSGTLTNVSSSGTVQGQENVGGLVGSHVDANNFPNSSPLVYTWNGSKYVYTNDVGGLLPKDLSGIDLATIDANNLAPKDGKYSMKITEEYNETVYYDKLALMTFDHAPGYSVVEPLTSTAGVDGLRTVSDTPTHQLVSCVDEKGTNCTDALKAYDDQWSFTNQGGNYNPANLKKSFVLDFGDLSEANSIQLVIRGARDYAASAQYPGNSARSIQVKDANGNWVEIYNKNQLGSDGTARLRTVDLTGKFLTNDYRVKVAFDTFNANYFAVDTSAQVPFTANTYQPESVDLGYYGFSEIDRSHFYDHDYSKASPLPRGIFKNQYGKFTKYGDVTPLLNDSDDQFVVMRYGDQLSVEFPYIAPVEGMERSFVLYNDALYKHATYQGMGEYSQSADYLPYRGMTKYGPGMAPYPMTPENTSYINTWNTRVVPGPFPDALRSGGSTIIESYSTADVTGNSHVGGLVGNNNKEIRRSYFTGTIAGGGIAGGIAGANQGNGWIHDSYAATTIEGDSYVGGITGINYGTIERVYSSGTVHSTGNYTGGITGADWGSDPKGTYDSFTVSEPTTGGAVIGGYAGSSNMLDYAATGNYWYSAASIGVDGSYANPQPTKVSGVNYFKANNTSAPMTDWDFDTIWQATANYPVFRFAPTEPEYVPGVATTQPTISSGQGRPWTPVAQNTASATAIPNTPSLDTCPADQILTQNLKAGARNGKYHPYTKAMVKEVKILQGHMNRLGFNSGPVDGILGKITDGAIKRMQKYLGTDQDGMVGPVTRGLINKSCGANGLAQ
ncbi:MAG: peptidoglycan-binding protein [bacterium]